MKILLVSTNPRVNAEVRSALLGGDEREVLEVRTPQRALAVLDEDDGYDIVLADNDTAPTGGYFLAREIKAREEMGRAMPPVVLLIAREVDKFLGKWSRADAYVLKPVDPFDLAEVVEALVDDQPVPALPGVGSTRGELPGDLKGLEGPQGGPPVVAGP